jgi:hypothetical protein
LEYLRKWEGLKEVGEVSKGYHRLRERTRQSSGLPFIPYIGMFLTDLVHIHEQSSILDVDCMAKETVDEGPVVEMDKAEPVNPEQPKISFSRFLNNIPSNFQNFISNINPTNIISRISLPASPSPPQAEPPAKKRKNPTEAQSKKACVCDHRPPHLKHINFVKMKVNFIFFLF